MTGQKRSEAEVRVALKRVHLCCGGCVEAVTSAARSIPGVSLVQYDMAAGTVILTARDRAAAQAALDAIAAAGLHGQTGDERMAIRPERNFPTGKVRSLKICGVHNCCEPCFDAINGAIETVHGVDSHTGAPGKTAFEVRGEFSPAELLRALNEAGFHARVQP